MKARSLVFALCVASAAMHAESPSASPDWFDAFRGKAYLQGDASFVAREQAAAPDAPPLFRARWVVLRYAGFAESERRFWPYRNLLLVTMPSGGRYVLESAYGFLDENHLDEERPWQRVASGKAAFEIWSSGMARETPVDAVAGPGPCEGDRHRVRAPGGNLEFFIDDFGSPTVRTILGEISGATFDEEERHDLAVLLRTAVDSKLSLSAELPNFFIRDPLLAVSVAFRDRILPPNQRTLGFVADPGPPGDLAAWRGLAHLPLDIQPFPALPPEKPIQ